MLHAATGVYVMKNRLLLLVLASAAVLSGCVTSAGYRGYGGGYYGASSDYYRYSRSDPYGYYGGSGSYYYGYDRYGYDRYGRSYGYPYGYAPYYNNRYYYYYPVPQRPPVTGPGTNPPQPDLDPNRSTREQILERRRTQPVPIMDVPQNEPMLRDLSRSRAMQPIAPAPVYEQPRAEKSIRYESSRGMREMMGRSSLPSRASEVTSQPLLSTDRPDRADKKDL